MGDYALRKEKLLEIMCLLAMAVVVIAFGVVQDTCTDTWGHALFGRIWWEKGHLPKFSEYSCVSDQDAPQQSFDFVPQVLLFFLHFYIGYPGVIFLKILLPAITCFFILRLLRDKKIPFSLALYAPLLFLLLGYPRFLPRGDLFNLPFTALYILLLSRYREHGGKFIWILVPLQNLWVHFHYLAIIGIFIVFTFLGEQLVLYCLNKTNKDSLLNLFFIGSACILASCFNLDRYDKIFLPFMVLTEVDSGYFTHISEFFPLYNPNNFPISQWLYAALVISILVLMLSHWRTFLSTEFCLFLAFAVATFRFSRFLGLFAIVAAFWVIYLLWLALPKRKAEFFTSPFSHVAVILCYACVAALLYSQYLFVWNRQVTRLSPYPSNLVVPVEAVKFIQHHKLAGNMYNAYNTGSYIGFHLYPQVRTFINSLTFLYNYRPQHYEYYLQIISGNTSPAEAITKYNIDIFLLDYNTLENSKVIPWIHRQAEWKLVYLDEFATIYMRKAVIPDSVSNLLKQHNPIESWREVSRITNSPRTLLRMGNFFMMLALDQQAEECYTATLTWDKNNALVYNNLGVLYERKKDREQALSYYVKAVESAPEYGLARKNLKNLFRKISYTEQNEMHKKAYRLLYPYESR